MAQRPTPTAIKKLAGNPGKRPMNEREILPTLGAPDCPDWLPDDARTEWNRIVPELDRLGVLTCVDNAILIAHCATYAEIVGCIKTGAPLKAALLGQLRAYACELGLSPASRATLTLPKRDDDEEYPYFFTL